jgi:hypothetical protein
MSGWVAMICQFVLWVAHLCELIKFVCFTCVLYNFLVLCVIKGNKGNCGFGCMCVCTCNNNGYRLFTWLYFYRFMWIASIHYCKIAKNNAEGPMVHIICDQSKIIHSFTHCLHYCIIVFLLQLFPHIRYHYISWRCCVLGVVHIYHSYESLCLY